ncbi:MAG TPA: mandelate racemase/muconate lactonizing enzyme family protein [Candidatus Bathyarchaeota archaeon]|nr:mandelate racemase/muconate lactonizing enzyme family protein [Candidatus Bathyarchaeota archaeon]
MRITEVKTYKVAGRGWPRYPWVFVEVCTDEGISGFGESTPREGVFEAISEVGKSIVGEDPLNVTLLFEKVSRRGVPLPFISGIEIALWDILGKRLNEPIYQLLGGKCRDRVRVYVDGFFRGAEYRPEDYARKTEEVVNEGFTALKMDVDGPLPSMHRISRQPDKSDINLTVDIVAAVRKAIGHDRDLAVDTHGEFNLPTIIELIRKLEPYDLMWIEDPVPLHGGNVKTMAKVTSLSRTPICSGETLTRPQFRELLELQAADIIMPDVTYVGGIMELFKTAAMADTYHVPVAPHNMYGPIATMASVQVCACIPNFMILEFQWADVPWRDKILNEPIPVKRGYIEVPDKPGIGVEVNKEELNKHLVA